jgi:hypothetical protein
VTDPAVDHWQTLFGAPLGYGPKRLAACNSFEDFVNHLRPFGVDFVEKGTLGGIVLVASTVGRRL